MNIKLIWVNRNVKPVTTKIYRLANPGDALVTPLATFTNNETAYVDTTVTNGLTYYYVLTVSDGTTTLTTTAVKVVAVYNTGPGPVNLKWGNLQYGYYGTVSYLDLFNRSEFLAAVGLIEATYTNAVATPIWDKWVRNGKTYFVPRSTLGLYTPQTIYNAGCYFGVDGPGLFIPTGAVSTPQNKTISKNGFLFTPMCPTGAGEALYPDIVPTGSDAIAVRANSMVSDFYYPTFSEVISVDQKIYRLQGSLTIPVSLAAAALTQNRLGTANILALTGSTGNIVGTVGTLEALTGLSLSSQAAYRPVLRLEQNPVLLG